MMYYGIPIEQAGPAAICALVVIAAGAGVWWLIKRAKQ